MNNTHKDSLGSDSFWEHHYAAVRRGRFMTIGVIVFVIGISLLTIFLYNFTLGAGRLPVQAVRLFFTVGLAMFLYKGESWARYVMATLLGIASLIALYSLSTVTTSLHPLSLAYVWVMIVGYAMSTIALVAVSSVDIFMEYQQSRQT